MLLVRFLANQRSFSTLKMMLTAHNESYIMQSLLPFIGLATTRPTSIAFISWTRTELLMPCPENHRVGVPKWFLSKLPQPLPFLKMDPSVFNISSSPVCMSQEQVTGNRFFSYPPQVTIMVIAKNSHLSRVCPHHHA